MFLTDSIDSSMVEDNQDQRTLTSSMEPYLHSDSEGKDEEESFLYSRTQSLPKQKSPSRTVKLVLGLIMSSLLIAATFTVRHLWTISSDPDKHNGQWTNCGLTIDDALARQCVFDMMGNNWVPPLCHDVAFAESSAEGNKSIALLFGLDEFLWYEGPHRKGQLENLEAYLIGQARRGEEVHAYTSQSWHLAHCMYWLSVGVNAMDRLNQGERDVWVPRVVKKPQHARHCSEITGEVISILLSEDYDYEALMPKVFFGYATCVPLA